MRFNDFTKIFMALSLALLMPGLAHAFGATQCAASRFGSNLVCSANDVSISSITAVGGVPSCVGGQSVTLDLDVTVRFGSPSRWDVGIFISNDGKDGKLLPANGGPASCSVAILPTPSVLPTSPFLDLDPGPWGGTRDVCGDGNGTIGGGTGIGVLRMNSVTLGCKAISSTGKLSVPFVVSWDNQSSPSGATCTSPNDPVPNTTSKCNATSTNTVDVVVLPAITKTDGLTIITPGDTTSYTITISNTTGIDLSTANSNAAVFKDPAVSNLSVSSVSCLASGGATCPAAGAALTVANMQGASGVTIPSMPKDSTVVFTVNAQLTGNPTGDLINVATVSSNGFSNSASDVDKIVYPSLVHMKTVLVISDPVNGASNPKFIPGAEALYSLSVTNTGQGTVDANGTFITDPVPANTELYVGDLGGAGSGPVAFTNGTPTSNLTWTYTSLASTTDDVAFSNNGGSAFTYTPIGSTYDPAVTHIRFNPKGKMAASIGLGNPSFTLGFKVRIK